MPLPATSTKKLGDLVPEVQDALQGRTDIAAIAPLYLKRAVQELAESYPFEELRTTGPVVTLTIQQSIYPVTFFLNPGDDYTFSDSFVIYVDFGSNTVTTTLDYRSPKAIEQMIAPATQGLPSKWTRYGQNIHLGPTPNNAYSIFMRYQIRHPFPSQQDATTLSGAPLYLPDTWEEITVLAAAERIANIKRWPDQRKELHDMLYGDPEFQTSDGKKGRPGLIAARIFQQERDGKFNSRQLTPIVPRYNQR